ncbi:MAG: hypothetical protein QW578_08670 [Thermoplasmatales archaeon]
MEIVIIQELEDRDHKYYAEIRASPQEMVKIYNVLTNKYRNIRAFLWADEREMYEDTISQVAEVITKGLTSLKIPLQNVTIILGFPREMQPYQWARLFGLSDKIAGRARNPLQFYEFVREYGIGISELQRFSQQLTLNFLFWAGETTTVEPVIMGNLQNDNVLITKDGAFRIYLKQIPAASNRISSAVKSYINNVTELTTQYRSFIDNMIKEEKDRLMREYQQTVDNFLDKLRKMYQYGYKLVINKSGNLEFFKQVDIPVRQIIIDGETYYWDYIRKQINAFRDQFTNWAYKQGMYEILTYPGKYPSEGEEVYKFVHEHMINTHDESINDIRELLGNVIDAHISNIAIHPRSVLSDDSSLLAGSYGAYHSNVSQDTTMTQSTANMICVGTLKDTRPAIDAIPLLEDMLKTMNADSAYNRFIGDLAKRIIKSGYDFTTNQPVQPPEGQKFAEFHTI